VFGIGDKRKTSEITPPKAEVTAETPASSNTEETKQTTYSSREMLSKLSSADQPQAKEPSSGISFKEAPKSLQKALKFLPEKAKEELTVFKVDENQYQISFDGPSSQGFFLGGLPELMHRLNPLKSLLPDQAKALLKQSERVQDLMPLLKQDKVHMQALFEVINEKTTKLIDLSLTDSPYGLLKDIFEGKNNEMKKLLTETINQILPEANAKTKKSEMPEINLSDTDRAAFLSLQQALKEKKPEAALEKAKPVIDVMARTYGLETLKNDPNTVKLEEALEISINNLVDKNRPKEGGNTTIFAKGHSSQEFTAPKIEINGFIPEKNEFKPGIITVINDNPNINLPLATLLTTLEMAHFANGGKLNKKLEPELIKAALANTKNAAEITANSQAKAAVAEMN
jgi:hypothetical protein